MEIKLITGATAYEACVNTIKQIDHLDLDMTNLVVVPDSFSMQAEKLVFDVLNIKSTLNIEVVGISRLASKILRNNNIVFDRVSGLEEIFCVFKVIRENEQNFKYFHKCGVEFCIKILQIIKQFKACKIKPSQIKFVGDELLDKKMADLKLVYQEYEKCLGERLDLSKLLEFFIEKTKSDLNLSKINLFFVNFDSFSVEINSFICSLAKKVNKTYIGMARPISQNNAFIYEDDIFKKTVKFAKENGVLVQVENFETALKTEHLLMAKNLFGFDVERGESDYFANVVAKNKQDEVDFVAKYIKNKIYNGARFKDFAIAVSDEKYLDLIKPTFSEFGIAYYSDDASDLSETILGRFILKVLNMSKLGFDSASLQFLLSFPFKNVEEKERKISEIFYYKVEDETEFLTRYPEHENLINKIKSLKKCKKISNFSTILKELIDFIDLNYFLNVFDNEKLYKKESENLQSRQLIEQVLDALSQMAGDQEIDLLDFEILLQLAFKSVKVETIPSYIDAVYVGDATTSYFEDVSTLFVLGATANSLPKSQNDIGIIDDEDIKKLRLNFALEPEIKVLNRRARLKIFEMLQHGLERLIVCTPISEDGKLSQRADFVNDLLAMFGNNVLRTLSLEDVNLGINNQEESLEKLLFYLGCQQSAASAYSKLKIQEKVPAKFASSLNKLFRGVIKTGREFVLKDNSALLKNVYSASELESFFACPFKHFLSYNLNVKRRENIEPNKRLFGIFQHALLNEFFNNYEENSKDLDEFLSKNVEKFAKNVYDEKILNSKHFLNYLFNESPILLKNLIKEQENSQFKPILLEEKIFYQLEKDKNLVGYVDRVDRAGEYFRIIDYKTGKTENVRKELFYGKKLQLFLYAKAIKKRTGLNCAGVYYFDCQTKYQTANQNVTLLKGVTLKDDKAVEMTDKRLWQEDFRSDLIGMSRKKESKDDFSFKNGNPADDLDAMIDYAKEVSLKAVEEMESGFVEPKPFKDECLSCPYLSICKYSETNGYRPVQVVKNFKRNVNGN